MIDDLCILFLVFIFIEVGLAQYLLLNEMFWKDNRRTRDMPFRFVKSSTETSAS